MYDVIQSWFTGVVVVMVIVGVLNTVGLLLLGIPYAAFFGFLASALLGNSLRWHHHRVTTSGDHGLGDERFLLVCRGRRWHFLDHPGA